MKERKPLVFILSHGVFYRPCDTPAGRKGWVGEITFYHNKKMPYVLKKEPIQGCFDTKEEAEEFLRHERYKLIHDNTIQLRQYSDEAGANYFKTSRIPNLW